jgi:hypothetical protein
MEEELGAIRANVQLAIERLGPLSGLDFGLNRESIVWIEGFIERQRARPDFDPEHVDGLVGVLGSFLGECLVVATGGSWQRSDDHGTWCVAFPSGSKAFPFAKVHKAFAGGLADGESIASFYDIAVNYVATGRLDEDQRRKGSQ